MIRVTRPVILIIVFLILALISVNNVSAKDKCKDKDGDGFAQKGESCGVLDCDDKNASVLPPSDGMVVSSDVIFCPGSYNLPNGLSIQSNNVVLDCNGVEVCGNGVGIGILTTSSGVVVKNCSIRNYDYGIREDGSVEGNLFENNNVQQISRFGIYSTRSNQTNIIGNAIHESRVGVWLEGASNIHVDDNEIYDNESYGVLIYRTTDSVITANNIYRNGLNADFGYLRSGIHLSYASYDNDIYNNILRNNLPYNVHMRGSSTEFPERNVIWNNQVYVTNISGAYESHNTYCVGAVGNIYYEGAGGPLCSVN